MKNRSRNLPAVILAVLCPVTQIPAVRGAPLPLMGRSASQVAETANPGSGDLPSAASTGVLSSLRLTSALARLDLCVGGDPAAGGPPHAGVRGSETDKSLTTQFADGWFAEETAPTGPFHWMTAEGHVDVTAKRGGTLVVRAHVRSIVPDNSVEVLMDGKQIQSVTLSGVDWGDCLVRIPMSAGTHHLSFRSHQAGSQPPGDNRVLTICVQNLQLSLES